MYFHQQHIIKNGYTEQNEYTMLLNIASHKY